MRRIYIVVSSAVLLMLIQPGKSLAQISPGPLSRPHQSLNGPTQCIACHKLGTGSENLKCLGCHTEIASRVAAHRGYHAAIWKPSHGEAACAKCHSEHNGENFQLIHWVPSQKAFDHNQTGYVLEGKHAGLTCQQCHTIKNIPAANRTGVKIKDLSRTFLGLSPDCLSCHVDRHAGQLGRDCLKCHTFNDWKTITKFNHAETHYPLTGEHNRVPCAKCHKPEPEHPEVIKYVGLAFKNCIDCHTDPHRGKFKATCESCHNTAGWKKISETTVSEKFDHSKTKYPLLGKHAGVRCEQCHLGGDFNRPVAFAKCMDCHKDAHHGQFVARKDGGDCAPCHTVDGFKPSTFSVATHQATKYPLVDKHVAVPCAKCHIPKGLDTLYKITAVQCRDCHADIHVAQFAGPPWDNRCESCHTIKGFKPSTYPLARHSTTKFPLTGGHLAVACVDCHKAELLGPAAKTVPYHFKNLACTTCHADPHRNEFASRMQVRRADGSSAGCEACHSTVSWTEKVRFDHETTKFRLTGAHRAVTCINCHKPPNLEVTMKNVVYSAASKDCEGCHEDPHGRQFARNGKNPVCTDCHNTARWKPSLFDHETRTTFSLKGGHTEVPCRDCHKTMRTVEDKSVLFFKLTPRECSAPACHGASVPLLKKESSHAD